MFHRWGCGGVAVGLWLFHFRFLWERRWIILLGVLLISAYTLPLDGWAVARGWGGFNPAYVSGIYLFGGSLLWRRLSSGSAPPLLRFLPC